MQGRTNRRRSKRTSRRGNPRPPGRVVLYAKHKKTGRKLHVVSVEPLTGRVKFSSKGKPHYYRGAAEAQLAAWSLMDQFPKELRAYELYWR